MFYKTEDFLKQKWYNATIHYMHVTFTLVGPVAATVMTEEA